MSRASLIGLTGGIASGKTAVSSHLKERGFKVIDSDVVARSVVERGTTGLKRLVEHFGEEILTSAGELNRKLLGEMVFQDEDKLKQLNGILHPLIEEEIKKQVEEGEEDIIFLDIPLLFEANYHEKDGLLYLDEIWLITLPKEIQLQRLMARDKINRDFALSKINAQWSLQEKLKLSSRIIDNSDTPEHLYASVDHCIEEVKSCHESNRFFSRSR